MQHRYIGKTGLRVSPICLETMTFGTQADKKEETMEAGFGRV